MNTLRSIVNDPFRCFNFLPGYGVDIAAYLFSEIDTFFRARLPDRNGPDLLTCSRMIINQFLRIRIVKFASSRSMVIMPNGMLSLLPVFNLWLVVVDHRDSARR
ncbi:hypothetical protein D3C86_2003910 [compost metagenome]